MRPLCVRVARHLKRLFQSGFRPRTDTSSYVEWDPREMNALADSAANQALDERQDRKFVHQETMVRALAGEANFRLCFDGARRGDGRAAAGLALIAYYSNGDRDLLLRAGKLLGVLGSAFMAESLAFEWSLEVLSSHIVVSV